MSISPAGLALLKEYMPRFTGGKSHQAESAPLDWQTFIDKVTALASLASEVATQGDYVSRVERLLGNLNYADSHIRPRSKSARPVNKAPRFYSLEDSMLIEVKLISFDPDTGIPAHDHPNMTGVMTCTSGEILVNNYDKVSSNGTDCILKKTGESTLGVKHVSTLTSVHGNIHELHTATGCEMVDIFTPPYSDARLKAMHWYAVSSSTLPLSTDLYAAAIKST